MAKRPSEPAADKSGEAPPWGSGGGVHPLHYIAEPLRGMAVPLDSLVPNPTNANTHSRASIEAIRKSLERFGQRKPIVVRKRGMVVTAGDGTLAAARQLGWTHIAAVVLDDPDTEAMAYAIADNQTAKKSEFDDAVLAGQLEELSKAGIALDALGFEEADLAELNEPVRVQRVEPQACPKVAWLMVGLPIDKYGEASEAIAALENMPGAIVSKCVADD